MKRLLGIFLILVSLWGFFYLGGLILFINSLFQIKEAIELGWIAKDIIIGVLKILFVVPTIEISCITLFLLGRYLLNN